MPKQPSWPDADTAPDAENLGIVALTRDALLSPAPAPEAERAARDRALAQFREAPPATRTLRPEDGHAVHEVGGWAARLLQRLRRK